LSADARVLVDYARRECESYKLTLEDPVSVSSIARSLADIKQAHFSLTGQFW
jgi:20S proteasome subunit alpha 4